MIKNILVILAILFVAGTHAMAYNYYSMSNPANPISPLNPMNPANPISPLNPIHINSRANAGTNCVRKTTSKEEYTYNVYKVYELCYKGSCRQTRSHELKTIINRCLSHGGGTACLNKVID